MNLPVYKINLLTNVTATPGTKWGKVTDLPLLKPRSILLLPDSDTGHSIYGQLLVEGVDLDVQILPARKGRIILTVNEDSLPPANSYGEAPFAEVFLTGCMCSEVTFQQWQNHQDFTIQLGAVYKPFVTVTQAESLAASVPPALSLRGDGPSGWLG